MRIRKQSIPWMMAAGRALLGPVLIVGERCGWNGLTLAGLIVTALLSDIFDGVLARRWRCDTAGVRLFDSMADTFFYACVVAALWMGQPALWASWRRPIVLLLALEAARIGFDFAKFGKPASYHSYLAKTWGLVLAAAVVAAFATGRPSPLLTAAVALGAACNVEGLAMSLLLPEWRKDVKTLAAAWRLRQELRPVRRGVAARAVALIVLACIALPAIALDPGEAKYAGGTVAGLTRDTTGRLDVTKAEGLVFTAAGGASVEIPFDRIRKCEQSDPVTHRLGVLATVAVGLVKARQRRHIFSISYSDAAGKAQLVMLEAPKSDVEIVSGVLRQHVQVYQVRGAHVAGIGNAH